MIEEIKKILSMKDGGRISNEEAAELIAAIKDKEGPERKDSTPFDQDFSPAGDLIKSISSFASSGGKKFKGKLGPFRIDIGGGDGSNNIIASKVDSPAGQEFIFEDNYINLSNMSALHFEHSANFSDNRINASTLNTIAISHGDFVDNKLNATFFESFELNTSDIRDCVFNGCKLNHWQLSDSEVSDTKFQGVSVKNLRLEEKSSWNDVEFNGCSIQEVSFNNSKFSDLKANAVQFSNSQFQGCEFTDISMLKCHFDGVRLENVKLSDLKIENFHLKDQVITGTEEFIRAAKEAGARIRD